MRREDGRRLTNGHPMARLLLNARLHPTLDINRVARVLSPTAPDCIKNGAQLTDITIYSFRSEVLGAAALKQPEKAKMRAVKGVDLRATTLIPIVKKTNDVRRSCVEKGG